MSAEDNLSQELFFEAHRGVSTGPKHKVKKNLGMHWSTDEGIADMFSSRVSAQKPYGVIVHAKIPMSSVETDTATLKKHQVYGSEDTDERNEKEVPVKKGSSVFVTGVTKRKGSNYRTRTYNPPREKKA
jgi:hypothetical protein